MGYLKKVLFFSSFLLPVFVHAELKVPKLQGFVNDYAGLLSENERSVLESKLYTFKKEYGPEVVLLTVSSLENTPIESFSIQVVDQWKLGDQKRDDGVLLLISKNDRKLRIEVGQGLEGDLTDALSGRIIREGITPYFKEGRFADGIYTGLQAITESLGGSLFTQENAPKKLKRKKGSNLTFFLVVLLFVFFNFTPLFWSRRRGLRRGTWYGDSGRHGGGGFGGFGGLGGGGGFSGGGSSGSW